MSYPEISAAWSVSHLNTKSGAGLLRRTLVRHRDEIAIQLGIEIPCNKSSNKYYIANSEAIDNSPILEHLINTLTIEERLRVSPKLKGRIVHETAHLGSDWLAPIVEAMDRSQCIRIIYQSFHSQKPEEFTAEPYCLKCSGRRWYVLARNTDSDSLLTYGLDRIIELSIMEQNFELPVGFSAESFFADYMGVLIDVDIEPQKVLISVDSDFAPHIRNVPLHISQKEGVISYKDGSMDTTFEWFLKPTPDFIMELYRYGSSLEVIEPEWLRREISSWAQQHNALYEES